MADPSASPSELEQLREARTALEREVARLRQERDDARRTAARREEAKTAQDLSHAGELAASASRTAAAEVDAGAAWKRAAELGASLGRRIAEGQARLIASQSAVTALEGANAGLAASRAAIALREADLRAVMESAIDCAIITTDRDGLVLAWNSGARHLLGWDEAQALTMDLAEASPPEDRERGTLAADIEEALSGGRVSREGWLRRQDGSQVWAGIEAMAVRADGSDAPAGVLWMLRDRSAARRNEVALRESEARHRLLIESWAQAVWETDAEGVVVADSPSWRAYTGQTLEEWLGYGWLDAIHPDDRAYAGRQWRQAVADRGLVDAEFRLRAPDGGWRWTNVRAAPVLDAAGRVEKWVGMNIDVDARKRAEAALRESEARHRTLFETIDEGYLRAEVVLDADGKPADILFLEANPAAIRIAGRDFTGRRLREVDPDYEDYWIEAYGQVALTGEPLHAERYAAPHDRWFEFRAYRVGAPGGLQVAVLFQDVTARHLADAALRESEARYQALFERMAEGFAVMEALREEDGLIADFRHLVRNPASERVTGLRAEDVLGRLVAEVLPPAEARYWINAYADVLTTGEPARHEHFIPALGRWFAVSITPYDRNSVAVFYENITERKRAEEARQENEDRQVFLLRFSDALRAEPDADAIANLALRLVADELGADRCYAAAIDPAEDRGDVTHQFTRPGVPPVPAVIRLSDFPGALARWVEQKLVISDAATEPGLTDLDRRSLAAIGFGAVLAVPLRRGEGHPIWTIVAASAEPRPWAAGQVALAEEAAERCWAAMERARAEAALREREERLSNVLDGMTEGFGLLAPDFTILEHNLEALRMDGRPREEIVGRSHWEAYAGSEDTELGRLLKHAMAARVPVSLEHRYAFENGQARWLDMRAYPTPDGGLAVFWRDVTDRKAAEAALEANERKYRTLFEAMDEGYCIIEMLFDAAGRPEDYRFLEVNGAFERQTGLVDATGRRMRDLAPAHEAHWFETYGRIALTGTAERFVHRAEALGRWYDVYAFRIGAPELSRVAILFNDITARKQVEDALRDSEERFRGFAENSADVLWIVSGDGTRLEYLSPAFERTFGEPRDGIMADLGRFHDLVHPEDREAIAGLLPRALAGETAIAHYRVVRPADGSVVYLRDTGFPIRGADGAVARAAGVVQDVTDLAQAAAAREAEKERFRTLAEGIPQLVWRSAPHGRWTWASPQWAAYTGQDDAGSLGEGWLDAVHPAEREAAAAAWDNAEAHGLYQADFRLRHAGSGHYAWFQTRGLPVRDAAGALVEWIGACSNIDDQMRAREALARSAEELERRVQERTAELMAAEESLRQSQKLEAIGQLTGGIAHDFNNMLQGVGGALAMAQRRLAEGRAEDVTRYMQVAGDATARAAGLTRRLLAFARRQRLDPRPVDPDALIRGMDDLLRRTMGPAIEIEFRLRDGAGQVLCDPSELESAVLNLSINARDAMPTGGHLTIATDDLVLSPADIIAQEGIAPGPFVSIRIEDTGTGMTPEVLEHVLEPFFTTKPLGEGTGLGLSQVHGFVRQSGGTLRIASAPGRGTSIQLLLPRSASVPAEPVLDAGPAPRAGRPDGEVTVLIVDDETAVRVPAAERLRDLGYRVVEANDGPTALRLLDEGLRPDILVTDVGLPNGMDGRTVTEEARRRRPDLPVVFVTGYARVALPDDAVVVTKPFDLDVLARRLAAIRLDPG